MKIYILGVLQGRGSDLVSTNGCQHFYTSSLSTFLSYRCRVSVS